MGIGFWKVMWNVGWDYARNYAWRDATSFEMFGAFSDLNEILRGLSDFSSVSSDRERVKWMNRNYENLFRVSKSLFGKFRKVFRQPVSFYFYIFRLISRTVFTYLQTLHHFEHRR